MLKVLAPSGDLSHSSKNLREAIVGTIHEFLEELKEVGNSIATQSLEHLHAKEIVMTFGKSRTVEQFLKFAAQKRTFEVVVVESSPEDQGQDMATSLASAGIETCLIPDSAVFAIMARVNKVIVGTHAVMANGGLISVSGTHMIAQAAKHFNVPFVVCTGLYKLSPLYAHDQDSFNELKSPSEVLPFSDAQRFSVSVKNPAWDYTPPELVALYITNTGAYSPTYIYRLLAEYYHPEDMDL
jgi:translation initiation factor eIF-2B subunit beta